MTNVGFALGTRRLERAALAAVALLAVAAAPAAAQRRPDSLTMTCIQARAFVAQRGAVILGTGQYVYDRIVADQRFCPWPQHIERTFVRTKDASTCFVGYVCRDGRPDFPWFDD